jgi:hypothetical protein
MDPLAVAGEGGGGLGAAVLAEGVLAAAGEPASAGEGRAEGFGACPALAFDVDAAVTGAAVCGFGDAVDGAGAALPFAVAACPTDPADI